MVYNIVNRYIIIDSNVPQRENQEEDGEPGKPNENGERQEEGELETPNENGEYVEEDGELETSNNCSESQGEKEGIEDRQKGECSDEHYSQFGRNQSAEGFAGGVPLSFIKILIIIIIGLII